MQQFTLSTLQYQTANFLFLLAASSSKVSYWSLFLLNDCNHRRHIRPHLYLEATRLLGNGVNSSRITARSRQLLAAVLLLQNSSLGSTLKTSMMQILIQICRHCLLVLSIPRSSHLSNSSSACLLLLRQLKEYFRRVAWLCIHTELECLILC